MFGALVDTKNYNAHSQHSYFRARLIDEKYQVTRIDKLPLDNDDYLLAQQQLRSAF